MLITDGKHKKCQSPKCDKGVARWPAGDVTWWSPYWCKDHVCHVGPDRCKNRKSSKAMYCNEHATCGARGCSVEPTVKDLSRRALPWFCSRHVCKHKSHGERCVNKRCSGSDYCDDHHDYYCAPREEEPSRGKCSVDVCPYQRCSESWFCSHHKCAHCHLLADFDGCCAYHRPQLCCAPGCDQPKALMNNNELSDFCLGHRRCSEHAHGCDSIISCDMIYCELHMCGVPGCHLRRYQSVKNKSHYCQIHCCIEDGCINPCAVVDDSRYQRCVYHTCALKGCYAKASCIEGYCEHHTCIVRDCYNGVSGDHIYCVDHECKDSKCLALCRYIGGYCADKGHACAEDGCLNRCGDDDYPNLCHEHGRKTLRQYYLQEGRKSIEADLEEQKRRAAELQNTLEEVYWWAETPSSESSSSRSGHKHKKSKKDSHRSSSKERKSKSSGSSSKKEVRYEWERDSEYDRERWSGGRRVVDDVAVATGRLDGAYRYVTLASKR